MLILPVFKYGTDEFKQKVYKSYLDIPSSGPNQMYSDQSSERLIEVVILEATYAGGVVRGKLREYL